jgi:hypothetical protein
MDDHTFLCYAREDAGFSLALAGDLKRHGIPIWVDQWNIEAGQDWDEAIDRSLRGCAVFLIVLSPAAVTSREVRGELRAALNLGKPTIPVLFRSCEIPRQLQNVQCVVVGGSNRIPETELNDLVRVVREMTVAGSQTNEGRHDRQIGWPATRGSLEPRPHQATDLTRRELRIRRDLLGDVKGEAADRLAQSLPTGVALTILKEKQPDQVTRSWDADVRVARLQRTLLPATMGILDVIDDSATAGRLLILGAPGSGKTTILLQLTQGLVARAEADPGEPIPGLFNLSSWQDAHQTLASWLVDELKMRYGVRKDHGNRWLEERRLVPLLDGLDELPPRQQNACVLAINAFQQNYRPKHLVVCCRLVEYENVETKLQLNSSICLLPLNDAQILDYLDRARRRDLWESISRDPESVELVRSPLWLGMTTLAYEEISNQDWQRLRSPSDHRGYLLDAYIRHQLSRSANTAEYSEKQTVRWLACLAAMLKTEGQTDFLIEGLQPTCLQSATQRWLYHIGVGLTVAVIFSGCLQLIGWIMNQLPRDAVAIQVEKTRGFQLLAAADPNLLLAVVAGLIVATRKMIQPIETLRWSGVAAWHGVRRLVRKMSILGVGFGIYAGLLIGVVVGTGILLFGDSLWIRAPSAGEKAGVILGALAAAGGALAIGLLKPSAWVTGRKEIRLVPISTVALVSGVLFGVVLWSNGGGPLFVLITGLSVVLVADSLSSTGFSKWLAVGLVGWSSLGLIMWPMFLGSHSLRAFLGWMEACAQGGLGIGAFLGLLNGLNTRLHRSNGVDPSGIDVPTGHYRQWIRWVMIGMTTALIPALLLGILARTGHVEPGREVISAASFLALAMALVLSISLIAGMLAGMVVAFFGAFLGALLGVLNGLAGPDVERKTVPNQGIRQSAVNVGLFALIGVLAVGVPYGVMNVAAVGLSVRTVPGPADWLRFGGPAALLWGAPAGLVPGAACIQHFTLRFVLWCCRQAPWHYGRFLNYATERMFLQRVGGRYRFIHVMLRDHFARSGL